jgi:hypothetical protein
MILATSSALLKRVATVSLWTTEIVDNLAALEVVD